MNKPPKRAKGKKTKAVPKKVKEEPTKKLNEPKRIVISEQEAGSYSTSKKRIALIVAGQSRNPEMCWYSQQPMFNIEGYELDYFVHTWLEHDTYNMPESKITGRNRGKIYHNIDKLKEKLYCLYEPKSLIVEDYYNKKILESCKKIYEATKGKVQTHPQLRFVSETKYLFLEDKQRVGGLVGYTHLGQTYSIQEACRLKSEFEIKNGFKYDIVVKIRQDLLFNDMGCIRDILEASAESGVIANTWVHHYDEETKKGGLAGDLMFASDSETMDSFCLGLFDSLVDNYIDLALGKEEPKTYTNSAGVSFMQNEWPESILYHRAKSQHIKVSGNFLVPYVIYRDYMVDMKQDFKYLQKHEEYWKHEEYLRRKNEQANDNTKNK